MKLTKTIAAAAIVASGTASSAVAAEVAMRTSKGEMLIFVDEERAPKTAANFLQYVPRRLF